ncbi:MAG: hypothetical protein AAB612_04495 [Patescibacteria group bacterium]
MTHLFFLGRQHDLSQAELEVVLQRFGVTSLIEVVTPAIVSVDLPESVSPSDLMNVLGGTVKIAVSLINLDTIDTETIEKEIANQIDNDGNAKTRRTFVLAEHNRNHLDAISHKTIKRLLTSKDLSVRYIETSREGAEAGLLLEGKVTEYHVIHLVTKTVLAKTVAVQDVHNWSHRDMDKPYRDKKKGMIPPKLARTMINLAVGENDPKSITVFDPFCGTGTILMEGLMVGVTVMGSDLDSTAVHGAGQNLQWLVKEYGVPEPARLSIQDAVRVSLQETGSKIDCIVTEPFLGKPNPTPANVDNILKGLEKMYIGAFKQWKLILKTGGKVAIVFPVVTLGKSVKTVQSVIDRLESLGYTRENGPYIYTKLHAPVQRAVYVYRLKE